MTIKGMPEALLGVEVLDDEGLGAYITEKEAIDNQFDGGLSQPEPSTAVERIEFVLQEALAPEASQDKGVRNWAMKNVGKLVVGGLVSVTAVIATGHGLKRLRHAH